MAFRAQLLNQQRNMFQVPGHDCIMKDGQAAKAVELILEFTATQLALLAEAKKS